MFNWFKRKLDANWFHGVDLNNWNYVGYTHIFFNDPDGLEIARAAVFGFVSKTSDKRCYSVVSSNSNYSNDFDNHSWVQETAELWRIGERHIWQIATEPSLWLLDHMKMEYNLEWKNSQWSKIKPQILQESDSNVVTLQFSNSNSVI